MEDDEKPDNVIQFRRFVDALPVLPADDLLADCMGDYDEVIILGVDDTGEMVVSGNISDIAQVYEMLSSAAQNIALAHLEMIFQSDGHA
jgi:hypothetical protein